MENKQSNTRFIAINNDGIYCGDYRDRSCK